MCSEITVSKVIRHLWQAWLPPLHSLKRDLSSFFFLCLFNFSVKPWNSTFFPPHVHMHQHIPFLCKRVCKKSVKSNFGFKAELSYSNTECNQVFSKGFLFNSNNKKLTPGRVMVTLEGWINWWFMLATALSGISPLSQGHLAEGPLGSRWSDSCAGKTCSGVLPAECFPEARYWLPGCTLHRFNGRTYSC